MLGKFINIIVNPYVWIVKNKIEMLLYAKCREKEMHDMFGIEKHVMPWFASLSICIFSLSYFRVLWVQQRNYSMETIPVVPRNELGLKIKVKCRIRKLRKKERLFLNDSTLCRKICRNMYFLLLRKCLRHSSKQWFSRNMYSSLFLKNSRWDSGVISGI